MVTPSKSTVEDWTDAVAEQTLNSLAAKELILQPKRIEVQVETDLLGEDAWRLLLVLPTPKEGTWRRAEVFDTRRAAIAVFDELAAAADHRLPGSTIASITTDDAHEEDVALADRPEEGEDPGEPS